MKEFKYCHEEITMGVEIPVTVCETQKEMVEIISEYRKECKWGTADEYTVIYVIYKDGSTFFHAFDDCEEEGKFKRTGIERAVISTSWGFIVLGDFAIIDNGSVSIDKSDIEEYGVYAGQYDVKEQDEQELQETVEQTETKTNETTVETTTEQETVEGISKAETATAESDTEVEQNVETAEQIQAEEQKTEFKKEVITMTNKKLFKDAGSKGVYIDKLREKYPFRICRTSEPQFEAVLKGVQPLNDGDEIPIYRFPGGECCEDPFEVGTTIIEW